MGAMNVNLGPVFDKFVASLLKSGLYQTQSEVVREGLRMLKEREERKQRAGSGWRPSDSTQRAVRGAPRRRPREK